MPPGDRNNREDLCTARCLAVRKCSARRCWINSGAGRALAPGGVQVPPGGLEQFRLAACGPSQAETLLFLAFCVLFLTNNDALLESGDAVP